MVVGLYLNLPRQQTRLAFTTTMGIGFSLKGIPKECFTHLTNTKTEADIMFERYQYQKNKEPMPKGAK